MEPLHRKLVELDGSQLAGVLKQKNWRQKNLYLGMLEKFPEKYASVDSARQPLKKRNEKPWRVQIGTAFCIADVLEIELRSLVIGFEKLSSDVRAYILQRDQAYAKPLQIASDAEPITDHLAGNSVLHTGESRVAHERPRSRVLSPKSAVAVLLLLSVAILLLLPESDVQVSENTTVPQAVEFIVSGDVSETHRQVTHQALREANTGFFEIRGRWDGSQPESLQDLVARRDLDAVIEVSFEPYDRFIGASVRYINPNSQNLLWQELVPRVALDDWVGGFSQRSLTVLKAHVLGGKAPANAVGTANARAFKSYRVGRLMLDRKASASAVHLGEIIIDANSSLKRDPDFALAHALKCEAHARRYWLVESDLSANELGRAKHACERADSLAGGHPDVIAAAAIYQNRVGKEEAALKRLEHAMSTHPHSVSLRLAAAEAHFKIWRRSNSEAVNASEQEAALARSFAELNAAIAIDPTYWAPYDRLGAYAFDAGDSTTAFVNLEKAADLNPSELAYANLGTLALCKLELDRAEGLFDKLQEQYPYSHLGPEKMGELHFFRGEHRQEAKARQRGLKLLGSRKIQSHRVRGGLAAALHASGELPEAESAYQHALLDVNDDLSTVKNPDTSDYAHRAYYLQRLSEIDGQNRSAAIQADLIKADAANLDIGGQVRVAQVYSAMGELDTAQRHFETAIQICPVYRQHPDRLKLVAELTDITQLSAKSSDL